MHRDPTDPELLRAGGAEVRALLKQAAAAGARLVHFTEGALSFPSKVIMSELGPDEIGPSDWTKADWTTYGMKTSRRSGVSFGSGPANG